MYLQHHNYVSNVFSGLYNILWKLPHVSFWHIYGLLDRLPSQKETAALEKDVDILGLRKTKCSGSNEPLKRYLLILSDNDKLQHTHFRLYCDGPMWDWLKIKHCEWSFRCRGINIWIWPQVVIWWNIQCFHDMCVFMHNASETTNTPSWFKATLIEFKED